MSKTVVGALEKIAAAPYHPADDPPWYVSTAQEALDHLRKDRMKGGGKLPKLYICESNHVSSVTRLGKADGPRKCFFCTAVVEEVIITLEDAKQEVEHDSERKGRGR